MNKCVFVIDHSLPVGLIANTAAVLSLSLGRLNPQLVGPDLQNKDGETHAGITTIVMPVLKGDQDVIYSICKKAKSLAHSGLQVFDVTDAAQSTKNYTDYANKLSTKASEELRFLGVCLYGPTDLVKSLTGSLPLLRE
jgi:hypothetical protein